MRHPLFDALQTSSNQSLEPHIPSSPTISIHLPHPALADEGGDVVIAEAGADFKRHGLWMENWRSFYAQAGLQGLHRMPLPGVCTLPQRVDRMRRAWGMTW